MAVTKQPRYQNTQLPINLCKYLMRGKVTTGFTGRQSSGKTTSMVAAIEPVDARLTIRTMETAFELYLREIYPERNIYSVAETEYITTSQLQDALKKSDAALSIVGEVATDAIAARMLQAGQVASLFTIFSHHATTTANLVYALRNSLINSGAFSKESIAEQQVIDVVKMDCHLDFDLQGNRIVERFTQIVPLAETKPYDEYDPKDPVNSINRITRDYYARQTDRATFTTRDIMRFNRKTNTYEVADFFTPELCKHMVDEMTPEDRAGFARFVHENWGY